MSCFGRVWLVGLVLVGCGAAPAVEPDAAPPLDAAPFVPGPNLVHLETFEEPAFVAYRDGFGPWTTPEPDAIGAYELHVTDAYEAVVVCGHDGYFESERYARTFGDGGELFAACFLPASASAAIPATVTVDGTMIQPGIVTFGDVAGSAVGPWQFELDVPPGRYDLIAVGDAELAIRRDQPVVAPETLPTIDLAQEGAPFEVAPFSVSVEAGELVYSTLYLGTARGFTVIDGTPTELHVPPPAMRLDTDSLDVGIYAETEHTVRSAYAPFASQASFPLLPAIERVTYSYPHLAMYATWTALPSSYEELELAVDSYDGSETVSATRAWIEATGRGYLAFDDYPPAYDRAWSADLSTPTYRTFAAYGQVGSSQLASAWVDRLNGAVAPAPGSP